MKLSGLFKSRAKTPVATSDPPAPVPKRAVDFKQILEEFRTLDPKDPGLWPAIPRALTLLALLAGLVVAAWWFDWTPRMEELEKKRQSEVSLKEQWVEKKKQAVNLDAYRAQLAEIDASFGVLLEQLPNESEIGALLVDINKAAQGSGLSIERFKPGGEARKEFYAEIPIDVEFTGNFHDLGTFSGDVAQLPRIVTLNNIDLSMKGKTDAITMKAVAKTFRYLDEAELAAQRKGAKGGGKGKKK